MEELEGWEIDAKHQRHTFMALMGLCGLGGAWESYTIASPAFGDTFSATIRALAEGQLFIPFMFGMLMSHLFWSHRGTRLAVICGFIAGIFFWKLTDAARKQEIKKELHESDT